METEIIRLWDNERYEYPLIEIKKGNLIKFKTLLNKYREENQEDYNNLDFYDLLYKEEWFIKLIKPKYEIFF